MAEKKSMLQELKEEIDALHSKTITITTSKTERLRVLSTTTDTATAKAIVEKTVLPALKTLSREGKIGKKVVLV